MATKTSQPAYPRSLTKNVNPDMVPELEIEEMLHFSDFEYAFLDLRNTQLPWLRTMQVARPSGFVPVKNIWPNSLDGLLFLREMKIWKK